jgi:hypothetical protein
MWILNIYSKGGRCEHWIYIIKAEDVNIEYTFVRQTMWILDIFSLGGRCEYNIFSVYIFLIKNVYSVFISSSLRMYIQCSHLPPLEYIFSVCIFRRKNIHCIFSVHIFRLKNVYSIYSHLSPKENISNIHKRCEYWIYILKGDDVNIEYTLLRRKMWTLIIHYKGGRC